MARARNIKPGFFENEELVELEFSTRLLFIGLWTVADREGRLEDRPKRIKMALFPADDIDIDAGLNGLQQSGFIIRYKAGTQNYIHIANFTKHQNPHHKEVPSVIPPPDGIDAITKHSYDVSDATRNSVFSRDGFKCLKCSREDGLSIDHITPLSKGGNNEINNLQTLCKSCNSSKGDTTKDHRKSIVEPTLNQQRVNKVASCPSDSLIPDSLVLDSLIPDSGLSDSIALIPEITLVEQKPLDIVSEIFAYWQQVMKSPKSVLDDSRRKIIGKALKIYSPDDILKAIRGCSKSPHNMGQNDQKTKYNGLGLILRNAEKIDRFIQLDSAQAVAGNETLEQRNARIIAEVMSDVRDTDENTIEMEAA